MAKRSKVAEQQSESEAAQALPFSEGGAALVALIEREVQSGGERVLALGCMIADLRAVLTAEFPARKWQTKGEELGLCEEHLGHLLQRSQADKLATLGDYARGAGLVTLDYGDGTGAPVLSVQSETGATFVALLSRHSVGFERVVAMVRVGLLNQADDFVNELLPLTGGYSPGEIRALGTGWPSKSQTTTVALFSDVETKRTAKRLLSPKSETAPDLSGLVDTVLGWPVEPNGTSASQQFTGLSNQKVSPADLPGHLDNARTYLTVVRAFKKASDELAMSHMPSDPVKLAQALAAQVDESAQESISLPDGRRVVVLSQAQALLVSEALGTPITGKRSKAATANGAAAA
jgi:hypothetical protein